MADQYRVMWQGHVSSLAIPLEPPVDTLVVAKMIASSREANELRAEGCRIWIELRPVGAWRTLITASPARPMQTQATDTDDDESLDEALDDIDDEDDADDDEIPEDDQRDD